MSVFLERIDLRQGGRVPLSGGAVSIGRSPGNTFALTADDRGASAYHAVIYSDPQRMLLQDLQSTNGTFVNGRKVFECVLGIGDEIGLGRSGPKFRIVSDDDIGNTGRAAAENDGVDNINDINDTNAAGGIDTADPGSSLDAALTGIIDLPRDADDGADTPPPKHRVAVVAATVGLVVALTLLILIPILSSAPKTTSAGKDFFSAAPTPPPTPTSTPAPAADSTARGKINAVLTRFGEDGYRAPPEMVERVEHYLNLYTTGSMRGTVTAWMERSRRYFPMIRAILTEKNIPIELAYVSMLESGLNPQATSHAGAVGLWQFMPQTARRYGLRVGGGVDERTDPEKATRAAAAYFKDLIAIFGSRSSVLLCMAAYNAGEQRVINALKRIDDPVHDRDFWYLYRMGWLAQETNEYIPQVIALIILSDGDNP